MTEKEVVLVSILTLLGLMLKCHVGNADYRGGELKGVPYIRPKLCYPYLSIHCV